MTITMIAVAGIMLGFLCLIAGFFMQGTEEIHQTKRKAAFAAKRKAA